MNTRAAIAQYEATVVLVVISLALASVVYEALRPEASLQPSPTFVNGETPIGGTPAIERIAANASSPTTLAAFSVDGASSSQGILAFSGSAYSTVGSLCAPGQTTFFSVYSQEPGTIEVATNGTPWIAGTLSSQASVASGWQEVMIQSGSSCSVTLPGGQPVPSQWVSSSSVLSSIPVEGALTGTSFTFYVPSGGGTHGVLVATSGGLDDVSI